ncbi:PTS glucitol/sorbitol transporter subunit IIB [Selenomonas sp. TAMA-11512]|uniref:PTS glucitol/sorbitol transporter subunit IIB n=1 Tax=Selenomonas sp. TAMA-11512 TaxID=3095337 RepID=UPI0030861B6B|nr:PTS glucitol/sorbitol transporter subunit IIB [Selenomonas sp. TAMA-11512]
MDYNSIKVVAGSGGWGGPLVLRPTEERHKIVSVTGGGIHPLADKIAEMTGGEVVDGFTTGVPDEEILVAIVDCGGTARCGVYPKKNVLTINLMPVGKVGPLAKFIVEELYVSAVTEKELSFLDPSEASRFEEVKKSAPKTKVEAKAEIAEMRNRKKSNMITRLGMGIGGVVNKFYAAGRETIEMTIKSILPFMAFVSMILGIISASGLGNVIATTISPLASTLPGMLIISLICAIPFISPILGPGAVIAQVVGTLLGAQIGLGNIPPQYALPALFAINAQVGADFVPVGLSLGEADPDTIELGVPAVLYSRVITGPFAVAIAYAASIGLY